MTGPEPRRRLGATARREGILAAALPEFAKRGYDRTRVADIAAKVGVTEPVVFQNFGSKADLFAAVLERAALHFEDEVRKLFDGSGNVQEGLARLLSAEYQDRLHSPGALGAIFAEAAAHSEPAIRQAGHRAHQRVVTAMTDFLRREQVAGAVREDVDAEAMSVLLLSLVPARQFRRTLGRTSPSLEQDLVDAVIGLIKSRRH